MDETRSGPTQGTILSFLVATISLGITGYTTWLNRKSADTVSHISSFNALTGDGLSAIAPMVFDKDPRTNRTLWETVETSELHAGLERLEVAAWVPPHSHTTEEIAIVYAGSGLIYDENGQGKTIEVGALVHIAANSRHAFRNVGEEPLIVGWVFPSMFGSNKHKFQETYKTS